MADGNKKRPFSTALFRCIKETKKFSAVPLLLVQRTHSITSDNVRPDNGGHPAELTDTERDAFCLRLREELYKTICYRFAPSTGSLKIRFVFFFPFNALHDTICTYCACYFYYSVSPCICQVNFQKNFCFNGNREDSILIFVLLLNKNCLKCKNTSQTLAFKKLKCYTRHKNRMERCFSVVLQLVEGQA